MLVRACATSGHEWLHTKLVVGSKDANVFLLVTEKDVDFLCICVSHVLRLGYLTRCPYCQPYRAAWPRSGTLVAAGRLEESLAALLIVLHQEQGGLMAVAHCCCIRLHSLLGRVSPSLICAPVGIEPYLDPRAVAPELPRHFRVAESPQSAAAWR